MTLADGSLVDFLFALTELSSLLITVPELCVQLGCIAGRLTSLQSNFTWTGSFLINHSWHRKTRDTGISMVKTASFCIPSIWHNIGVTDYRGLPVNGHHLQCFFFSFFGCQLSTWPAWTIFWTTRGCHHVARTVRGGRHVEHRGHWAIWTTGLAAQRGRVN